MLFHLPSDDDYDSDEEDDKPQYIRLVYNAHAVARFLAPPADDTHSINSSGSMDSTDSPGPTASLSGLFEVTLRCDTLMCICLDHTEYIYPVHLYM